MSDATTDNRESGSRPVIPVATEAAHDDRQQDLLRAGVYELLAHLLAREPGAELLQSLTGIDEVDGGEDKLAMGWELLRQSAARTDPAAVRDEYFNLFIGVGRGELVPFGSWYLTGFLMEKPVSVLRSDLDALGIERQEGVAESEDHIAALCDAMALIIRSGTQEVAFERQVKFFNDHLGAWAPRFFADLQSAQAASFYRAVGFFGESFFEFEEQLLSMQS